MQDTKTFSVSSSKPIPASRLILQYTSVMVISVLIEFFIEPIGGAAPKFSSDAKLSLFVRRENDIVSLLCPAQGAPVPSFR